MADLSEVGVFLLTEEEEENTTQEVAVEELNNDDEFTFVYDEDDLPIPTNREAREQFDKEVNESWLEETVENIEGSEENMALSQAEYIEKKRFENDEKAKLKKAKEDKARNDFMQKELYNKHQKKMAEDMERDEELKMAENRRLMAEAKKKNARKKLESFIDFNMAD
ncbi:MAG: hypothetical protein ACRCW7_03685 [Cetobacterium sp.]